MRRAFISDEIEKKIKSNSCMFSVRRSISVRFLRICEFILIPFRFHLGVNVKWPCYWRTMSGIYQFLPRPEQYTCLMKCHYDLQNTRSNSGFKNVSNVIFGL